VEINRKHLDNPSLIISDFKDQGLKSCLDLTAEVESSFWVALLEQFPLEDWLGRPLSDLFYALSGFLNFVSTRASKDRSVSVSNPSVDSDRWVCGRTVVMFCCKDSPFLVDTVRMVLEDEGYAIHVSKSTVFDADRDRQGHVRHFQLHTSDEVLADTETFAYFEITAIADPEVRVQLASKIEQSLMHVEMVVRDYSAMIERVDEVSQSLDKAGVDAESVAFLNWLKSSHFTFLGYRELNFSSPLDNGDLADGSALVEDVSRRLGTFKAIQCDALDLKSAGFSKGATDFYSGQDSVCFSKSGTRSTVHRNIYPDYVVFKKYDDQGRVIGEARWMGFFTYSVSSMSPLEIPILRHKVKAIQSAFGLNPRSHDGKRLIRAINLHPKDELFQASTQELFEALHSIVTLNERDIVRFIVRKDVFSQFVSCLLYVPRDLYTTNLRQKIQTRIAEELGASQADVTTFFSESKHARAHMIFRLNDDAPYGGNLSELEPEIIELANGWLERFRQSLDERFGEHQGALKYKQYCNAFPQSYQEQFDARSAVIDIDTFESLNDIKSIAMRLYQPANGPKNQLRFRVSHLENMLELSDVIPVLENMGLRVLGEQPFKINGSNNTVYWLHDFQLTYAYSDDLDIEGIRQNFEEAFAATWAKKVESDNFNTLVLVAGIDWRKVNLLRAYANYMKQTLFQISVDYIASTLISYPDLCKQLVELFDLRFNPSRSESEKIRLSLSEELCGTIYAALDDIATLNQDKVIRRYVELMMGTLRTNVYQGADVGNESSYISLKIDARSIKEIPEPRPAFEFFVYSARVEGVHLRTSKVARGGLRWSDRREDYRTEVLGLVKAQQVKNAVIVPSGAKGGFVAKQISFTASRAEFLEEGIECYKIFIRGLLDLTDNIVDGAIVKPLQVVCLDDDDPYLVVAADKGTATFSDIANEISISKGHWLGDAFASGGSQGYDHKGMGITAKGAWVSVQRHFRELGLNTQKDEFTVVGVGDMAGDVFGNGMLLSKTIRLVAAFNHLHIFIDPQPDAAASFVERSRLFENPRLTWDDYDKSLISKGGGVFKRSDKFIPLSPEMQALLETNESRLTPNDLITLLLKSKVDLLWNGGIGTYVKASSENHSDVGDKANDCLRVNGDDLRCRVFGEGGNLGMTQRGRVEFSLKGGACNTDFIDNAAGVDCSDHEVNIKILIDAQCRSGDLTEKQRNQLLVDMTDEVSDLVLDNNDHQTMALSIAEQTIDLRMNGYRRFINYLVDQGRLDRALEFLPEDAELVDRLGEGLSLSRPELSVLISYAKVQLKEELAVSNIADDSYCAKALFSAFPSRLAEQYPREIEEHKLRKEIIATQLANDFIHGLGITALHRLFETTGATSEEIVKAYVAARDIFNFREFVEFISSLDYKIEASEQYQLIASMSRRVRRGARWFLKNRRSGLDVATEINRVRAPLAEAQGLVGGLISEEESEKRAKLIQALKELGVSDDWLDVLSMPDNLFSGLGVVEVANQSGCDIESCAEAFFLLLRELKLDWFATQLSAIKVENYWQANARESYIDDLEAQLRKLAAKLLQDNTENQGMSELVSDWVVANQSMVGRWTAMVNKVESTSKTDYAMFSVALKELHDFVQAAVHG